MATPRLASRAVCTVRPPRRVLHTSGPSYALSPLCMPALSPTMSSGRITSWRVSPGSQFSAGDVLFTIETDKAEVDVEAQEDGWMGKQLVRAGEEERVNVGGVVAILGEEEAEVKDGEVEVLEEWVQAVETLTPPSQSDVGGGKLKGKGTTEGIFLQKAAEGNPFPRLHTIPKSSLPLSPAVLRLLLETGTSDSTKIKGTGLHGRLTKGDVLAFLGRIRSPHGTSQVLEDRRAHPAVKEGGTINVAARGAKKVPHPLDGPTLRRLIVEGLGVPAEPILTSSPASPPPTFSAVLASYIFSSQSMVPPLAPPKRDLYRELMGP